MAASAYARALAIAVIGSSIACSSPSTPSLTATLDTSSNAAVKAAVISIVGLTATVEPLTTTPQPGLLYRLTYQVRESGGRFGANLVGQRIVLSDATSADGPFNSAPHVGATGTITVQSTLSVYPTANAASHVTFTLTYQDDAGQSGTATAEADITRIAL